MCYRLRMWQPIETAPRDFTPILLWHRNRTVIGEVGYYDFGGELHARMALPNEAWFDRLLEPSGWDNEPPADAPTHWMPLPEPPS